jgi:hypothetical protein
LRQILWTGSDNQPAPWPELGYVWKILVILRTVPRNFDAADLRPENRLMLCQRCQLEYCREHHRSLRVARKDSERPIFFSIHQAEIRV